MDTNTAIDMLGQKFNRFTVISRAETNGKRAYWNCLCECGETKIVMGKLLRNGGVRSCGCLHSEQSPKNAFRLPHGQAARNQLYLLIQREAMKQRELEFALTIEQFEFITKQNCFYCGVEPRQRHPKTIQRLNGCYTYNGIDRVDSDKGYTIDNCVAACGRHNRMKGTMSQAEFLKACEDVVNYFGKGACLEQTPLQELSVTT